MIATPSIDTVIFGAPELDLARIVNALDSGIVNVVDTDPLPAKAVADRPEALLSETTRTDPPGAITIFSASTPVVDVVDVAAATNRLAAPPATRNSRRTACNMPANDTSPGTIGTPVPAAFAGEVLGITAVTTGPAVVTAGMST